MELYPVKTFRTLEDCLEILGFISRQRQTDVVEYNNLPQRFLSGRSVGKIPVNSADVAVTDRIGDTSFDSTHMYVLQNTASPQWIKYTGSTF